MDIPPTIPTSFVPRSASAIVQRPRFEFTGGYALFAYVVLGIVFVLALGAFAYDRVLTGMQTAREAALVDANKKIDPVTVAGFIKLRDRLNSSTTLLSNHIALSGFFTVVEGLLPTSVRLSSLHLALDATKKVRLDGSGVARSFNALAALSASFAADGRIKEAIFSNLAINKDSSVSFTLSAALDPKMVAFTP